jgi:hypothetical protein
MLDIDKWNPFLHWVTLELPFESREEKAFPLKDMWTSACQEEEGKAFLKTQNAFVACRAASISIDFCCFRQQTLCW